jgi:hypothetical protein
LFCLIFISVFCSTLALVKNHTHEWNTFTSWFIDWKVLLLLLYFFFLIPLFIILFLFIACIYSEIKFIRASVDVKIQRKTITFTKNGYDRTVFINKMINSGIMRMFIFFFFIIFIFMYSILLAKCYAFAQIIVMVGLVWEIYFLL